MRLPKPVASEKASNSTRFEKRHEAICRSCWPTPAAATARRSPKKPRSRRLGPEKRMRSNSPGCCRSARRSPASIPAKVNLQPDQGVCAGAARSLSQYSSSNCGLWQVVRGQTGREWSVPEGADHKGTGGQIIPPEFCGHASGSNQTSTPNCSPNSAQISGATSRVAASKASSSCCLSAGPLMTIPSIGASRQNCMARCLMSTSFCWHHNHTAWALGIHQRDSARCR